MQNEILAVAPEPILRSPFPKISRGENYLGLPYVVLDYPRIAAGEDLFFVRSFVWWGNLYSSTLQLSGKYRESRLASLEAAYPLLAAKRYFVGVNQNPWVHHFAESNYRAVGDLSTGAFATVLEATAHTKLAAYWPLKELEAAPQNLFESWKFLAGLIA